MDLTKRALSAFLLAAIGVLAACGGDGTPSGSNDGTTPPLTGAFDFTSDECRAAALAMAAAASGGFTGGESDTSLEEGLGTLRRMAEGAPEEIAGDIETLATATQDFYDELEAAGVDLDDPSTYGKPQVAQAVGRAAAAYQSSGAPAAIERIGDFFDEICPGAR